MATYAVAADLAAYIEGWTLTDAPAAERLLVRAERDLDRLFVGPADDTESVEGRKLVPADYDPWIAARLKRATCAQAEYRMALEQSDPNALVLAAAKLPEGTAPRIGPKVWEELHGTGLVVRSGSVRGRDPWWKDPAEVGWT